MNAKSRLIRSAIDGDAAAIAAIYNHYIAHTVVTFEESAIDAAEIADRIEDITEQHLPYLVAVVDGQLLGFTYASKWKGRCAYRFSVESTVYLRPDQTGSGVGTLLYRALFDQLARAKYRTVIGGISLPNPASIALHEKFGMQKVGHFKNVGYKFDRWVDVGYWQGELTDMTSV